MNHEIIIEEIRTILNHYAEDSRRLERLLRVLERDKEKYND
jgi:hypothetical protein